MADSGIYKSIYIMYPNGKAHPIKAQYVQVTTDGKYILNYLDFSCGNYVPSFTEIIKINDVWYKSPFHYDYDDYVFMDFDNELSEKIINELPENIKLRIKINDDRKITDTPILECQRIEEVNKSGAMEIVEKEKNDTYFVLFANAGNDMISSNSYPFDFPFPVFTIEGHNKDDEHSELEFSRCGLSNITRKEVKDILSKKVDVTISNIDPIEAETTKERYVIHFVSCSDIKMFNDIYKAKNINVDYELNDNITVEELLNKAFACEVPMTLESEYGTIKDNGVSKVSMSK